MSLVPVADIFNHKAAVVELSSDYAIEPVCFGDDSGSGSEEKSTPASEKEDSGSDAEAHSVPGAHHLASTLRYSSQFCYVRFICVHLLHSGMHVPCINWDSLRRDGVLVFLQA